MNAVKIAKSIMKRFQSHPAFDMDKVGELNEVFHHEAFLNADLEKQKELMLKSSQSKYDNEYKFPFDKYFGFELTPILKNKSILDLGCFTGGRSAAWFERYKLQKISGTDINPIYIEAANQYAKLKNINAEYRLGFGESLPFENDEFDAVLSFDVFEHVQDLGKTLAECRRVLKPGGKLIAVFPSYYHPIEHHLTLVTRFPGLHYAFSGKTLVKAYYEILKERGQDAHWYKRDSANLENWEKGNTINGMTFGKFHRLVKRGKWKRSFICRKPIGTVGRFTENKKMLRTIAKMMTPLSYVPYLQEIFLHRITVILEKDNTTK